MSEALDTALAQLADDCGIQLEYHDIWGNLHRASAEPVRALLAAFGVDAGDPAGALVARNQTRWSRWLEPVLLASAEQSALIVRVNVPKEERRAPLRWEIESEDGAPRSGDFVPAECPELERAEFDGRTLVAYSLRIEDLPFAGYHELRLVDRAGRTRGTARLLVAPPRCYRPPALEERRLWGP
ncbi:MAG TPA: hypothetical protein VFR86_07415, partial [Burkholderiaceae bacterium]|nr:hypothetical protein [Burkholderiaceae bacterium]